MNKFIKFLLITAGVFAVTGIGFGTAGAIIAGGLDSLVEQAGSGALNYSNWHFEDGISWRKVNENIQFGTVNVVDELVTAREDERFVYEDGVKNLEIAVQLGNVEIEVTDEVPALTLEIKDAHLKYFSQELKGDTLYIDYKEQEASLGMMEAPEITIYVPEDWELNHITAKTNLGNIEVEDVQCIEAELSTDMGNAKFHGQTEGDLVLKTAMGNVEAEVKGNPERYNIDLKTDMGNVYYGNGDERSELGGHYTLEKSGAKATICLKSSMGNVELQFEE